MEFKQVVLCSPYILFTRVMLWVASVGGGGGGGGGGGVVEDPTTHSLPPDYKEWAWALGQVSDYIGYSGDTNYRLHSQ